jgi:hypothetical protein
VRLKRYFDPQDRPDVVLEDKIDDKQANQDDSNVPDVGVTPAPQNNQNIGLDTVPPTPHQQTSKDSNDPNAVQPAPSQQHKANDNSNIVSNPSQTLQNTKDKWHEDVIERLIKVSRGKGQKWYRVKWRDKSPSTWVCENMISDKLKREYHIKHTHTGKKRKRPYRYLKT